MYFSKEALFWGTWRGYSFPRNFKRMRVFYQENFCWGIQQTFKRRLWKWATLSIGALLGNLAGVSFKRDSERQIKGGSGNRASLCMGAL